MTAPLAVDIITIFPDYLSPLRLSLLGKATDRGLLSIRVHDLRAATTDVHHCVDDAPYGGGPGMVMRPEPWWDTLEPLVTPRSRVIVPSPSGRLFTQELAVELAAVEHLIFACGRYEGIDQRVADAFATDVLSIGDYVLAGGEVATLVMMEAIARLIPGVVGNAESVADDSHGRNGLLEGPVYTRPVSYRGRDVPPVLRSGDHAAVARWRHEQALQRTAERRPDLLAAGPHPTPDPAVATDVGQ